MVGVVICTKQVMAQRQREEPSERESAVRLGFYTTYSRDTAEFAHKVGFRSLELSAWPGTTLDADKVTDKEIGEIRKDLASKDIEISALGYYPNYFDPDEKERQHARGYFLKLLDLAVRMDQKVIATFVGRDPSKTVAENLPLFKDLFARFCDEAEKRGIRIAIENCPMQDRKTLQGTNIAYSPEIWSAMFDLVPSRALGLEIDPSHMVWLGIDYVAAVRNFGDRIYHVHAKDMEIDNDILSRTGIYGQAFGDVSGFGHGWWRARTPGWGEVDWPKFISALIEVGYQGNIDIEHEDDVFAAAAEIGKTVDEADIVAKYSQERNGLILGYNTLSRLIT
jgi:sugar phosphate isomerase/epimerase